MTESCDKSEWLVSPTSCLLLLVLTQKKAHNFLFGDIPQEIGEIEMLKELNMMSNNIQGSIPPTLGSLGHMVSLDLGK